MKLSKLEIYMEIAHTVKKLSPDSETQVGAVMLSSEQRIIATSFNGFVRGAPDVVLPNTRPEKYEYIVHAEANILHNCCHEGIRTKNTTIICTLSPCVNCLRASFSSGVSCIIYDELYNKFDSSDFYEELEDIYVTVEKIGRFTKLTLMEAKIRRMI